MLAPFRDHELRICLGVELFGPESPDLITFDKTKQVYRGGVLEDFSPDQMMALYETTLYWNNDEILKSLKRLEVSEVENEAGNRYMAK